MDSLLYIRFSVAYGSLSPNQQSLLACQDFPKTTILAQCYLLIISVTYCRSLSSITWLFFCRNKAFQSSIKFVSWFDFARSSCHWLQDLGHGILLKNTAILLWMGFTCCGTARRTRVFRIQGSWFIGSLV